MKRYIFAATLALALPSHAANPDWVKVSGGTGSSGTCGGIDVSQACSFQWTAAATANSSLLVTGRFPFSCRLEPDREGAGTAATADVYCCSTSDSNSCTALQWDTDADGIVDDNTLDAANAMKIGTPVFMGCLQIYVDPTANPAGSNTAEVVCTGEVEK